MNMARLKLLDNVGVVVVELGCVCSLIRFVNSASEICPLSIMCDRSTFCIEVRANGSVILGIFSNR